MYIVYILFSEKLSRYYIGYTCERIETRIAKHLANHSGFTAKAKDWIICFTELYGTKQEAMQREQQIKKWKSHRRIIELIQRGSTE